MQSLAFFKLRLYVRISKYFSKIFLSSTYHQFHQCLFVNLFHCQLKIMLGSLYWQVGGGFNMFWMTWRCFELKRIPMLLHPFATNICLLQISIFVSDRKLKLIKYDQCFRTLHFKSLKRRKSKGWNIEFQEPEKPGLNLVINWSFWNKWRFLGINMGIKLGINWSF